MCETEYERLMATGDDATKCRILAGELFDLKEELSVLKDQIRYWSYCMSEGMRVTCPEKCEELMNFLIDLKIAPYYVPEVR